MLKSMKRLNKIVRPSNYIKTLNSFIYKRQYYSIVTNPTIIGLLRYLVFYPARGHWFQHVGLRYLFNAGGCGSWREASPTRPCQLTSARQFDGTATSPLRAALEFVLNIQVIAARPFSLPINWQAYLAIDFFSKVPL